MGKIRLMDEWLSNKIAAGEVVERPASVVKELVENAIDAGSTSIEVFLEEAGLSSIQVIDNGSGMDETDAQLCFSRHATSKIFREQDLFRIRTLGFRGEALASIAAVSKLRLATSDGESGIELELEGGTIVSKKPGPLRRGTEITVSQLFYNTPARLKYLKTIQTELGHSIDFMNRMAIAYPNIAFKLVHNGGVLLQTNGRGNVQHVLAAIYGMQIAKKMIPFRGETKDYTIHGYATLPEINRASKNYISIFVNGRWVKHYVIQKKIIDAYHTFLPIGRYPIVVLYIEGDPYLTDVNVHPAKLEIRLSKEDELLPLIENTIRTAVREHMNVPLAKKKERKMRLYSEQMNIWKQPSIDESKFKSIVDRLTGEANVVNESPGSSQPYLSPAEFEAEWTESNSETVFGEKRGEKFEVEGRSDESIALDEWNGHTTEITSSIQEKTGGQDKKEPFPELEVVGQIHGTYIVAQMEDGFYLIDQHAAQERLKYEYYREKVGEVDPNERQALLLPLTFHYTQDEALTLKENQKALEEVGVFLEEFGPSTFVVREHPTWFPKGFEQEIIEELIEQVLKTKKADVKKLREEAAMLMSCKQSIKANHYLTKEQMEALLEDLRKAEDPFTCPHGRPVMIHFSTYEIEKMFKRVM